MNSRSSARPSRTHATFALSAFALSAFAVASAQHSSKNALWTAVAPSSVVYGSQPPGHPDIMNLADRVRPGQAAAASKTRAAVGTARPSRLQVSGVTNEGATSGLTVVSKVFTPGGWVRPGEEFPMLLNYRAGSSALSNAKFSMVLHPGAALVTAPAGATGSGTQASPLVVTLAAIPANGAGSVLVKLRAKTLAEDPEIIWKNIFSTVSVTVGAVPGPATVMKTHGPKVAVLESARFGDRPFPVVMVQYQDIKHCTDTGERGGLPTDANDVCPSNHSAVKLDEAVNSRTTGRSLWQLYQDMSFGQLFPIGQVSPPPNTPNSGFSAGYIHKFSTLSPNGTCTGQTLGAAYGTPLYTSRISEGWYNLPGTQAYYGADKSGHALAGAVSGQGALFGIDDACGPTGKIVYDAASIADPEIDYNEFDTDKDGVVDFFNLMYAGDGGNGNTTTTGLNNIWPHKSDLRFYFTDSNKLTGYVSNDQLKTHAGEPLYYTDNTRQSRTTTVTPFPVYVVVGPYNVNPESAVDTVSVVAHEYGHSLGMPDFYSLGSRETYGSWELMASDHFQFMTSYARQKLGWIVPAVLTSGSTVLRESKTDTGSIQWTRPDNTPYTLTGEGIHNADVYRVGLPKVKLIDAVPSGTRAWHSGAGNDFGCPGHTLDVFIPDLEQYSSASAVTLKFKSWYEMEWDFDYGFVMVSEDGVNYTALPSAKNTTIANTYNPNQNGCMASNNNGITGGSASGANTVANLDRATSAYPAPVFIDDQFDLTAYKGKKIFLRFAYATDPGLAKRGWFIDDINVTATTSSGEQTIYSSDFEKDHEPTRLFPRQWSRVSTADGVDVDHAYFIEMRDRINNDFDGKGQSDRGAPTWEPGVLMIYSDENHGFGNTGVDNPPAQSPVDSNPQPLNDTPNLNDAAFILSRPTFNGCTHIDNYGSPSGPGGQWKLPNKLKFTVTEIMGLSTTDDGLPGSSPAQATILAEINPDCNLEVLPPVISIGNDYENPDTNSSYSLNWTRPAGAVGPDVLQEATACSTAFTDNAEAGLGKWVSSTMGTGAQGWSVSSTKVNSGSSAFWGNVPEGMANAASILTMKNAIVLPNDANAVFSYYDFHVNEGDDIVVLEITKDNGATWEVVNQSGRSALAPDAATALQSEKMSYHEYPLDSFKGQTVKLRFRFQTGAENRAGSTPLGWYVDDIKLDISNFADLSTVAGTTTTINRKANGDYCYRVRTAYPAGAVTVPSPFSNVVTLTVANTTPVTNLAPIARLSGTPTAGTAPLTVNFSGLTSSDPDAGDRIANYEFDFGDRSAAVTNADGTVSHVFNTPGTYTVTLRVRDSAGLANSNTDTNTMRVVVEEAPKGDTGVNTSQPPAQIRAIEATGGSTSTSDGSGRFGGGAMGLGLLPLLGLALLRRRKGQ